MSDSELGKLENLEITDYDDYRGFLKACFSQIKKQKDFFSYEYCGRKLGVTKAHISLVLNEKRHFSSQQIANVLNFFEVPERDYEYFINLFLLNSSKDRRMRNYFSSVLHVICYERLNYGGSPKRGERLDKKETELMADVLKSTIHSLSYFSNFEPIPEYVLPRLNDPEVTEEQVLTAVREMIDEGCLIKREGESKWVPGPPFFKVGARYTMSNRGNKYLPATYKFIEYLRNPSRYAPGQVQLFNLSLEKKGEKKLMEIFKAFEVGLRELTFDHSEKQTGRVFQVCSYFFAQADQDHKA